MKQFVCYSMLIVFVIAYIVFWAKRVVKAYKEGEENAKRRKEYEEMYGREYDEDDKYLALMMMDIFFFGDDK